MPDTAHTNIGRLYAPHLQIGDTVRTPLGREAVVRGCVAGRYDLEYVDPQHGGVVLEAGHLTLVQRAD